MIQTTIHVYLLNSRFKTKIQIIKTITDIPASQDKQQCRTYYRALEPNLQTASCFHIIPKVPKTLPSQVTSEKEKEKEKKKTS